MIPERRRTNQTGCAQDPPDMKSCCISGGTKLTFTFTSSTFIFMIWIKMPLTVRACFSHQCGKANPEVQMCRTQRSHYIRVLACWGDGHQVGPLLHAVMSGCCPALPAFWFKLVAVGAILLPPVGKVTLWGRVCCRAENNYEQMVSSGGYVLFETVCNSMACNSIKVLLI